MLSSTLWQQRLSIYLGCLHVSLFHNGLVVCLCGNFSNWPLFCMFIWHLSSRYSKSQLSITGYLYGVITGMVIMLVIILGWQNAVHLRDVHSHPIFLLFYVITFLLCLFLLQPFSPLYSGTFCSFPSACLLHNRSYKPTASSI